ncbi:glycine-rich RNA-binding protein GRP1A-like [Camellia sinensis]|uniref:glycine-rich RNA-binding protein GRP1A-like n=1 Tax=Camellia sinensis TaxID=4442 RepID=UPI001035658C|nr:glycine-rich RNA-binding protein GRP1A-like [Camellia sinensis]
MSVSSTDSVIGHEVFVGGLAGTTDDQDLVQAFSEYGVIVESKIIKNRETGKSRGFGFVKFKDEQAMRDAIEGMHGQYLTGRNITVSEAKTRGSGGGGGVGLRSHGGGYNRGRGGYRGGAGRDGGGYGGGPDRGYSEGSGGHYSRGGGGSDVTWATARITIDGLFRV